MNYRNESEKCTWYHVMNWQYPHVVFHVQAQWKGHAYEMDGVPNWILCYEMKVLGDLWYIELYGAVTFWGGNTSHTSGSTTLYCVVFSQHRQCGCQQFTVIHLSYVYKFSFDGCHTASAVVTVFDQIYCMKMFLRTSIDWYIDLRYKMSVYQ